jgi:hypothetical protein
MTYLAPWSYGCPTAFGALLDFDENASTISVAIYGVILKNSEGIFRFNRKGIAE